MTITGPTDDKRASSEFACPRCSTLLSQHANFCRACGSRIEIKNGEGQDASQHEVVNKRAAMFRIPFLSRANWKGLQPDQSLESNEVTGQVDKSSLHPLEASELSMASNKSSSISGEILESWGWLPLLSLTSAIGVLIVALSYNAGRFASQWADPLYWIGLSVIFLPIALRLFSSKPARRERITLIIILAIALYLVKFLQYPLYFTYYDEFAHLRSSQNIVTSGHLFQISPLLPIGSYYPGLSIATTALSNLTGLSLFASGTLLIGVVRLIFVLALYLFYEHFDGAARMAGIATVLYMANPGYLFFDADFSYESLALPLAVFVLFMLAQRKYGPVGGRRSLTLAIILGIGAVVITHHITSYTLVAFLLLWTAVVLLFRMIASYRQNHTLKDQVGSSPGGVALLGIVLCIAWIIYTGGIVIGYLAPHFQSTVQQIIQILARESAPRQLFQNSSGSTEPLWDRLIGYISVVLILIGLPIGFFQIWRRFRINALALALACGTLAYPISQGLRLTAAGAEIGERANEFLFLGIAFVLAIGVTEFWLIRTPSWKRSALVMGALCVICFGQLILASGQSWDYLPGPYLVSADERSIEPEGITAAEWTLLYLGPGHRTASDRINTLLMATYGDQHVLTSGSGSLPVSQIFTSLQLGSGVVEILQQDRVQYLVIDHRISTSLPLVGTYFNRPPSGALHYSKPIDPAALTKFDGVRNVNRIFDSGDIVIYGVEAIAHGNSAISTSGSTSPPSPYSFCNSASPTTISSNTNVAKNYQGTIHDISTGLTANISFTGIKLQHGRICGHFEVLTANAISLGLPTNSPFKGTITVDKQIHFNLNSNSGQVIFSFDGFLLPDGNMAGTYCRPIAGTKTCSDYGLWNTSPMQSG